MRHLILGAAIAALGLAGSAQAAVIINDGFEYADQAAFQTAWPAVGTTTDTSKQSAQLSTAKAKDGVSSVFVPVSTTATTALTEYRNRRSFSEVGNLTVGQQLIFRFDFYDSITGNPQRNYANLQDSTAPSASNQLISMGLNSNQLGTDSGGNYYMARILGYAPTATDPDGGANEAATGTSSGAYFKLNDFATSPLRSVGWHNLKVVMSTPDGAKMDYDFYVDGTLAEKVHGVTGTLRSYDNIAIGSGLTNGGANAYFDNMYLELVPVPEPASLSLLAFGALPLLRRRRPAH